jgi:putative Flp pilus-assembly TadE/G-like protein
MFKLRGGRRGQALLMVTLALFAMGGLMGLAVDLGWSYFVKKSAQSAADAAALGAAYQALATIGNGTYPGSYAQTLSSCPETGVANLSNGCLYAQQNGFTHNGHSNRQDVTLESGVGTTPADCTLPAPTAPCVTANYWVTARVVETIPQLFSALLGNTNGISSARATAAIIPVVVNGALWTLDRANDPGNPNGAGVDIVLKGHDTIVAPAGVVTASNTNQYLNMNGNTMITASLTAMSPAPNPGSGHLTGGFQDMPEGPQFLDPMQGLGQPPLPGSAITTYGVPGGNIANGVFTMDSSGTLTTQVSGNLPPGNYVPILCGGTTTCQNGMTATADTGKKGNSPGIIVNGTATFSGSGFGTYIFYGGLSVNGTMNVGAGEFVVAGGMNVGKNATITDPSSGTDAGQVFVLTGSSNHTFSGSYPNYSNNSNNDLYPGLITQINSNQLIATMATSGNLAFEPLTTQTGLGNQDSVAPSGINPGQNDVNNVPSSLVNFAGVVFWQDQANSYIKYTSNGFIDTTSCGSGHSIDSPCTNSQSTYDTSLATSTDMHLQAAGVLGMKGIIYQPRGASVSIGGQGTGTGITGAIQLITGSVESNGGGTINLTQPPIPLTIKIATLIE